MVKNPVEKVIDGMLAGETEIEKAYEEGYQKGLREGKDEGIKAIEALMKTYNNAIKISIEKYKDIGGEYVDTNTE